MDVLMCTMCSMDVQRYMSVAQTTAACSCYITSQHTHGCSALLLGRGLSLLDELPQGGDEVLNVLGSTLHRGWGIREGAPGGLHIRLRGHTQGALSLTHIHTFTNHQDMHGSLKSESAHTVHGYLNERLQGG